MIRYDIHVSKLKGETARTQFLHPCLLSCSLPNLEDVFSDTRHELNELVCVCAFYLKNKL